MYIYIYTYMHTHTHTHIYIYILYICIYIYIYICSYIYTCTNAHVCNDWRVSLVRFRRSLRQMTSRSGSEEDLKSPKEASPANPRPSHLRQPSCPVSPNGPTSPRHGVVHTANGFKQFKQWRVVTASDHGQLMGRMSGASSPKAAQSASADTRHQSVLRDHF